MKKYNKNWFTLIEVIVWITIFSIIIVSIITTLVLNTDINNKIDISRVMKENIWNVIDQINSRTIDTSIELWVTWTDNITCYYKNDNSWFLDKSNNTVCIKPKEENKWGNNELKIYLAKKDSEWIYQKIENNLVDCNKETCSIVLKDNTDKIFPITNEWITFTSLQFKVSSTSPQRVSIYFEALPAVKKWLREALRQSNKVIFQTTLAQRPYNYK